MTRDYVKKYYLEQSYNCAESILLAANEEYQLHLKSMDLSLVSGFGGGMGCGSSCGALCGALAAYGKLAVIKQAHATDGFKESCSQLVSSFQEGLESTICTTLMKKYKTEDTRCLETVLLAADVLDAHVRASKTLTGDGLAIAVTPEDIQRVKSLGFLHCKGTNAFNCRVITRNGKITNKESRCITLAADTYGNGEIAMTTRLTMEIQEVPYQNIEALRDFLATSGLKTGGTGAKVRPIVSCKGTTCQYGLCDTFDLSKQIHSRFFEGFSSVKLPHKFKIAVGGCPNNCVKPNLNDFGIVGQKVPTFDASKCKGCKSCAIEKSCPIHIAKVVDGVLTKEEGQCNSCGRCIGKCPFKANEESTYGYRIYIGGRWGKKTAHGQALSKIFTTDEEVLAVLEKSLFLFKDQGIAGERFADTIARLGFEQVQSQLLQDKLPE